MEDTMQMKKPLFYADLSHLVAKIKHPDEWMLIQLNRPLQDLSELEKSAAARLGCNCEQVEQDTGGGLIYDNQQDARSVANEMHRVMPFAKLEVQKLSSDISSLLSPVNRKYTVSAGFSEEVWFVQQSMVYAAAGEEVSHEVIDQVIHDAGMSYPLRRAAVIFLPDYPPRISKRIVLWSPLNIIRGIACGCILHIGEGLLKKHSGRLLTPYLGGG